MAADTKAEAEDTEGDVVAFDPAARDQQLVVRACWLYYMEGCTQGQIARELGLNRIRVNRMLTAARESGLVQVRIGSPLTSCVELEKALREEYGVDEAFVVPSPLSPAKTRYIVAAEGGRLLSERLHKDIVVAIGWGRTLRYSLHPGGRDVEPGGYEWVRGDDADQSVLAFLRRGDPGDAPVLVACNFTPVPRHDYVLGVPQAGPWREVLNGDAREYGGSGLGNLGLVEASAERWRDFPAQVRLTLPPLACVWFVPEEAAE